MYNLPLTTTLAAPLLGGGTADPGGSVTLDHVKCCLSKDNTAPLPALLMPLLLWMGAPAVVLAL